MSLFVIHIFSLFVNNDFLNTPLLSNIRFSLVLKFGCRSVTPSSSISCPNLLKLLLRRYLSMKVPLIIWWLDVATFSIVECSFSPQLGITKFFNHCLSLFAFYPTSGSHTFFNHWMPLHFQLLNINTSQLLNFVIF